MILGTICARGGSQRLPHKNVLKFCGRPLIQWTLDRTYPFDKLIVSTDDKEIAAACKGAEVQMRPPELATYDASKWDVFRHIVKENPCDILVDLDTGCPLREIEDVTACIKKLDEGFDVVVTAYLSDRNPYFNMVEVTPSGAAYLSNYTFDRKTITRTQDAPLVYSLSPSVFAIRTQALFEVSHWSHSIMGIVVIPRERAVDIDTDDDFLYAEWLMHRRIHSK